MRTTVIGAGHIGVVTAAVLTEWGHDVVAYDIDSSRIAQLADGHVWFHEPGLDEAVATALTSGRLSFTDELDVAYDGAQVVFLCVPTPPGPDGEADLSYVEAAARDAARHATCDLVLVEKSTVPVGTGDQLARTIAREQQAAASTVRIWVASNPEFLKEGTAVDDTRHPDRVVIGADDPEAVALLTGVYGPLLAAQDTPLVTVSRPSAELIKHASNGFLATKISFINQVARVCAATGADVTEVADGMGLDKRIGRAFLHAGIGYGGSCFPKDVAAFAYTARALGAPFGILEEVGQANRNARAWVIDALAGELWHLTGKTICLLGAAFKPGTDDLREAPAIWVAERLLAAGATVRIYDPIALGAVEAHFGTQVQTFCDPLEAADGAHAAVVCTEWAEVATVDLGALAGALAYPVLIDGRNVFDPAAAAEAGLTYHSVGRPNFPPVMHALAPVEPSARP